MAKIPVRKSISSFAKQTAPARGPVTPAVPAANRARPPAVECSIAGAPCRERRSPSTFRRAWFWTLFGAGVAMLLVGLVGASWRSASLRQAPWVRAGEHNSGTGRQSQ